MFIIDVHVGTWKCLNVPRRAPTDSTTVFGVSTELMQLSYDNRGNSVPTILLIMQRNLYDRGGLQAWFRELPSGVLDPIPPEQMMQCQSEVECIALVRLLPPTEGALLNWAVNLMADVVQEEHKNKMNARNIALVFAPNMTQMADPLTALLYAVQVMNFLKIRIEKTLREREDPVVEPSPAFDTGPSDDSKHRSSSQLRTENSENVNQRRGVAFHLDGPYSKSASETNQVDNVPDEDDVSFYSTFAEESDAKNRIIYGTPQLYRGSSTSEAEVKKSRQSQRGSDPNLPKFDYNASIISGTLQPYRGSSTKEAKVKKGLQSQRQSTDPNRPKVESGASVICGTPQIQLYRGSSTGEAEVTKVLRSQRQSGEPNWPKFEWINSNSKQLNRGTVPDGIDVHCLAGLIKAWFRELPSGVLDPIPPEQMMQCQSEEECIALVRLLPPTEGALLNWAVNLMADVVREEHKNKMNARNIALVFAPNMTQMADPLTALLYAVQVMNFLKIRIEKTLREREDPVVEPSPAFDTGPSDDSKHRSSSQLRTENSENVNQRRGVAFHLDGPYSKSASETNQVDNVPDEDDVSFYSTFAEESDARNRIIYGTPQLYRGSSTSEAEVKKSRQSQRGSDPNLPKFDYYASIISGTLQPYRGSSTKEAKVTKGLQSQRQSTDPNRPKVESGASVICGTPQLQLYRGSSTGEAEVTKVLRSERQSGEPNWPKFEWINSNSKQLNRGTVPDGIDVHCLAGLIKAWFRELPSGVLDPIPPEQMMQCQSEEECIALVRLLPPTEGALLNWAVNLMADVVREEHKNKMNARNIALVFAPNMTQMADPLTALLYAVQVMNFLKIRIEKTLREREDPVVEPSPAFDTGPSDDSKHRSSSQLRTENSENVNQRRGVAFHLDGPYSKSASETNQVDNVPDEDDVSFYSTFAEESDARNRIIYGTPQLYRGSSTSEAEVKKSRQSQRGSDPNLPKFDYNASIISGTLQPYRGSSTKEAKVTKGLQSQRQSTDPNRPKVESGASVICGPPQLQLYRGSSTGEAEVTKVLRSERQSGEPNWPKFEWINNSKQDKGSAPKIDSKNKGMSNLANVNSMTEWR